MREAITSMRTRLAARAVTAGGATAFIQVQDVRLFGEAANTLGDFAADGLDVHQAWLLLGSEAEGTSLRVGRQEMAFGGERLIGAVGWAQQGRVLDGARLRARPAPRVLVDVLRNAARRGYL